MKTCEALADGSAEYCQRQATVTVEVNTKFIVLINNYCDDHGKTIAIAAGQSGYSVIVERVKND